MKELKYYPAILIMLILSSCHNRVDEERIMVFSAASLSGVITEIVDSFEVNHNQKVVLNLASSGTLARQMEQGQLPGVYVSASQRWTDYIDSLGLVFSQKKKVVATNRLVLIAPLKSNLNELSIDSALNIKSLLSGERISLGDPSHVPAGEYAKESLLYYGLFNGIESEIIPAKDVRSALMLVELEETPLGIVYFTDAKKSTKVKVLGVFPEESHRAIQYVATQCQDGLKVREFYQYLNSPDAQLIWRKYGFE